MEELLEDHILKRGVFTRRQRKIFEKEAKIPLCTLDETKFVMDFLGKCREEAVAWDQDNALLINLLETRLVIFMLGGNTSYGTLLKIETCLERMVPFLMTSTPDQEQKIIRVASVRDDLSKDYEELLRIAQKKLDGHMDGDIIETSQLAVTHQKHFLCDKDTSAEAVKLLRKNVGLQKEKYHFEFLHELRENGGSDITAHATCGLAKVILIGHKTWANAYHFAIRKLLSECMSTDVLCLCLRDASWKDGKNSVKKAFVACIHHISISAEWTTFLQDLAGRVYVPPPYFSMKEDNGSGETMVMKPPTKKNTVHKLPKPSGSPTFHSLHPSLTENMNESSASLLQQGNVSVVQEPSRGTDAPCQIENNPVKSVPSYGLVQESDLKSHKMQPSGKFFTEERNGHSDSFLDQVAVSRHPLTGADALCDGESEPERSSLSSSFEEKINDVEIVQLESLGKEESLIYAEETLFFFDGVLKELHKRRAFLLSENEKLQFNVEAAEAELSTFCSARENLEATLKQQHEIKSTLEASLARSKGFLQRLSKPDTDISLEELKRMIDQSNVEGDGIATAKIGTEDFDKTQFKYNCLEDKQFEDAEEEIETISVKDLSHFTDESLPDFLKFRGHYIAALHPSVTNVKFLTAALQVSARETFALDYVAPNKSHRRESILHTALDFQLFIYKDVSGISSLSLVPNSEPVSGFDPDIPLCPYELEGVCADPYCVFQHVTIRNPSLLLPTELLPLPQLNMLIGRKLNSKGPIHKPEGRPAKRLRLAKHIPDTEHTFEEGFGDQSDFISLPPAPVNAPEEDNFHGDEKSPGTIVKFWWSMNELSVNDYVHVADLANKIDTLLPDSNSPVQDIEFYIYCGCCIAKVAILINAGQFALAREVCSSKFAIDLSSDETNRRKFMMQMNSLLTDWCKSAYAYNESTENLLLHGFNIQLRLCSLSLLCEHMKKENMDIKRALMYLESMQSNVGGNVSIRNGIHPDDSVLSLLTLAAAKNHLDGDALSEISHSTVKTIVHVVQKKFTDAMEKLRNTDDSNCLILLQAVVHFAGGIFEGFRRIAEVDQARSDLLSLNAAVGRMLDDFFSHPRSPSWAALLSPWLYSANIALSCRAQSYDKAYRQLESLLIDDSSISLSGYSEIMWSQFFQLYACLPSRRGGHSSSLCHWDLDSSVVYEHELLANLASIRGICLHHFCLENDWTLFQSMTFDDERSIRTRQACQAIVRMAKDNSREKEESLSLKGVPFKSMVRPDLSRSFIPRSILVVGQNLTSLQLIHCEISSLPIFFGSYFSNLKVLDLSYNLLQELPDSINDIKNLLSLKIDHNKLKNLPSRFSLKGLLRLVAKANYLSSLPKSIQCPNLQYLDLSDNPVNADFWIQVAHLPNLVDVMPLGNK